MADDDDRLLCTDTGGGTHGVPAEQGRADEMEDLGECRLHPGSLARGEDDDSVGADVVHAMCDQQEDSEVGLVVMGATIVIVVLAGDDDTADQAAATVEPTAPAKAEKTEGPDTKPEGELGDGVVAAVLTDCSHPIEEEPF